MILNLHSWGLSWLSQDIVTAGGFFVLDLSQVLIDKERGEHDVYSPLFFVFYYYHIWKAFFNR